MRKIEHEMVTAAKNGQNMAKGNTQVVQNRHGAEVYLYGNHIGTWKGNGFDVNIHTLERWPTVTTLSRLRAFGVNVGQMDHIIYLNGQAICAGQC